VVYLNLGVTKYGFAPPDSADAKAPRPRKEFDTEPSPGRVATWPSTHVTAAAYVYVDERQAPASKSAVNLRTLVTNCPGPPGAVKRP
jgi:hypothetical protein